jgi:predicted O-linked N-acetylglucosamine transferase (SPINDLY family)
MSGGTEPRAADRSEIDRLVAEAVALRRAGRLDESASRFEQALAREPQHAGALTSYAMLLLDRGEISAALSFGQRALAADPERGSAQHIVGRAQCRAGQLAEGIASLQRALASYPDAVEIHVDLGNAFLEAGLLDESERHLVRARELAPQAAEVWINLGNLYRRQHRAAEAAGAYARAIELDAGIPQAHNNLGTLLAEVGEVNGAIASFRRALELAPERASNWSNLLLALNWSERVPPAEFATEHRSFGRYFGERIRPLAPIPPRPLAGRRLKVGYVSSDFCSHAAALFIEPLLAGHDRSRFEIYAFHHSKSDDEVTARIEALMEHFIRVAGMSDEDLAQRICDEAIDILVDLNGHTAGNRLPLFMLKPAPIQVTWLGYLATTGLATMDYRLTDARADPPGMTEALHTEMLWRLPDTLWCYLPYAFAPEAGPLPAQRNAYVTFASLSNPAKLSHSLLEAWARILRAVPDSRLTLMRSGLSERDEEIERFFARRGIAGDRVMQLERQSTLDYLGLYRGIDIALDTWPCAGATTTCDALWMGVPVVTLAGERSFSRSGASILPSVGLPELATEDFEAYVATAVTFAQDPSRLAALRASLRQRMRDSPLTDAGRFAAAVESAYLAMAQRLVVASGLA